MGYIARNGQLPHGITRFLMERPTSMKGPLPSQLKIYGRPPFLLRVGIQIKNGAANKRSACSSSLLLRSFPFFLLFPKFCFLFEVGMSASGVKRRGEKEEEDDDIKNYQLEDVAWLASLSDFELDMLVSLKKLAIQRAKVIGHENLGDKFDLKTLRALGVVLMEYLKDRIRNSSIFSNSDEASKFLDGCGLLTSNSEGGFGSMDIDEIKAAIRVERKKAEKGGP